METAKKSNLTVEATASSTDDNLANPSGSSAGIAADNGSNEEPKVIAQIHVRTHFSRSEQFLYEYSTCCLCGGELAFTHVTNFVQSTVDEEACCPTCNIRTKQETHRLQ